MSSVSWSIFNSPMGIYRKIYCTTPRVSVATAALVKHLSFYVKVFYVTGMALIGELFCRQTGIVSVFSLFLWFIIIVFQEQICYFS